MSAADDSAALLTVQYEARVNVWVAPSGDSDRARQITDGVGQYNGVRGVIWMPDGRIAYISRVSGSQDIWLMNDDGTHQEQMTTAESRADVYPAVTPDGRYLVFDSTRTGNSNLWRIDSTGGNWKQLTSGPGEEFPSCSPDGKWVVYTSTGSTRFTLSRISIDGGQPVQITDRLSQWPVVSPDGKWIACWYRDQPASPWQIAIIPFDGGPPTQTFNVPSTAATAIPVRWAAKGGALDYVDTREGVSNIWRQAISGIEARRVTDFKSDQIFWFDWSRDGDRLACSRGSVTSDVVLLNGNR
jgi:TolB protein